MTFPTTWLAVTNRQRFDFQKRTVGGANFAQDHSTLGSKSLGVGVGANFSNGSTKLFEVGYDHSRCQELDPKWF